MLHSHGIGSLISIVHMHYFGYMYLCIVLSTLTVHNSRAHISDTATNFHGDGGPYYGCQVSPVFRPQFNAEGSIKTE